MRSSVGIAVLPLSRHKIIELYEIEERCTIDVSSLLAGAVGEPGEGNARKSFERIAWIAAWHLVALPEFVDLLDNVRTLLNAPVEQSSQRIFHRCRQILLEHSFAQLVQLGV